MVVSLLEDQWSFWLTLLMNSPQHPGWDCKTRCYQASEAAEPSIASSMVLVYQLVFRWWSMTSTVELDIPAVGLDWYIPVTSINESVCWCLEHYYLKVIYDWNRLSWTRCRNRIQTSTGPELQLASGYRLYYLCYYLLWLPFNPTQNPHLAGTQSSLQSHIHF